MGASGEGRLREYFLNKMKRGGTEPVYEKYILKMLGINRLKSEE